MYYKIRDDILFRKYPEYGYITDNSMFGFRWLEDDRRFPGEKYVSESGAVMLAELKKTPQDIDVIVKHLETLFVGVEHDALKQDTIDFFQWFVENGFLSVGETEETCKDCQEYCDKNNQQNEAESAIRVESCSSGVFHPNEMLRSIHIEVASECNERCVHCYIPHELKVKTIDTGLFYRIIEEGRDMNIVNVTLSGGEPLLHKDFRNMLAGCRDLDLSVNVLSNLTLLTEDIITEMKRTPLLSVQTSIYSMDPKVHDGITKLPGSLKKTVQGLLRLLDAGIPLQISCPVMKQNKDSFQDVIRWGKDHNIAVAIEPVIFAAYDGSGNNLKNRLSLREIGEAVDKQIMEGYANPAYEVAEEKEAQTGENAVCSICRYNFCVAATGDVFPCVGWQANTIGNLNTQSIREIWESSEKIKELRKIKRKQFPKCVDCKDRGYCTVCMMSNANENPDGDIFHIDDYHCRVASIIHEKVDTYLNNI